MKYIICIAAMTIIIWGVHYGFAQERRRTPEFLQSKYQALNRQSFKGTLPPARVEWATLTNHAGECSCSEDSCVIFVDRDANSQDEELDQTLAHEACHAATWGQEKDAHGPLFQACMQTK